MSRESALTAGLAVLGFALFLSGVWTARSDPAMIPDQSLYFARFVRSIACFGIAAIFRGHIPSVRRLFAMGAVFIAMYLVFYAGMHLSAPDSSVFLACSVVGGIFTGLAEACIVLLFAHLFSTYAPNVSFMLIAIGYLLNELLYSSVLILPETAVLVARPLAKAAGVALLAVCLSRKRRQDEQGTLAEDEYPLQHGFSTKVDREPLLGFLSTAQDWMLILAATTLFPFLFGLIAQICSAANTNSGLYDSLNELVAISLLVILVVFSFMHGPRFSFEAILYVSIPIFATGCLLLPAFWQAGQPFAGTLVKCGYTIYQVLFWGLLARKSYNDLRHTYLYFGIFYGLFELSTAVARLIGSRLFSAHVLDVGSISAIALFSLWLIAIYGVVFFAISRYWESRSARNAPSFPASADVGSAGPEPVSPFAEKFGLFCDDFELSEREREVLAEAIHGYSMENIGKRLYISRETVKTHLRRIYAKVGVGSKQELLSYLDAYEPKKAPGTR